MNIILILLFIVPVAYCNYADRNSTNVYMSRQEREKLKQETLEMFYHGYNAYMNNAYPADELMPLSCTGRYRGSHESRGSMDESMGNFSLTLIDSLDTLVLIGNLSEFEKAVQLVIRDVSFDTDVIVSVFETNIRVLGGLLSAHIMADYFRSKSCGFLEWYRSELLDLAKDLGYRLLPAFNTTTGIPYGRVNLKYGITRNYFDWCCDTCTACAGTMILEMAALSRLTGVPVFEEKAHKAMDELWKMRHRTSNLMGTVLNVDSGDWIRKDSGVGAGIDSYYEYCLKAYILLANDKYLKRFNTHYSAIMTYISQGPMLLDVHMHKPEIISKHFMDSLLAFWPGLQVLKGDLKPAIETHEMLYQVMQKHKFIPEAFTTDFQVHWGQHPLRPEFIESTYFLYRATGDHYYLRVGQSVLNALQSYARVPCGFASVSDVRTGIHEDSMDSFVLAETFKYLYLLFAEPSDLLIDLDDFIFTTEAHLLPLSISRRSVSNYSVESNDFDVGTSTMENEHNSRSCSVNTNEFVTVRNRIKNIVDNAYTPRRFRRLFTSSEFEVSTDERVMLLKTMGINVMTLTDGRLQLHHSFSNAKTHQDGENGLHFMQELFRLSKLGLHERNPQSVSFLSNHITTSLLAGPAQFGRILRDREKIIGMVSVVEPLNACSSLANVDYLKNRIAVVERGDCMFIEKARRIQNAGAKAGIIVDNIPGTSAETWPLFAMSGDGFSDDLTIPFVFLFAKEAKILIEAVTKNPNLFVVLGEHKEINDGVYLKSEIISTVDEIKIVLLGLYYKQTRKTMDNMCTTTDRLQRVTFEKVKLHNMATLLSSTDDKTVIDATTVTATDILRDEIDNKKQTPTTPVSDGDNNDDRSAQVTVTVNDRVDRKDDEPRRERTRNVLLRDIQDYYIDTDSFQNGNNRKYLLERADRIISELKSSLESGSSRSALLSKLSSESSSKSSAQISESKLTFASLSSTFGSSYRDSKTGDDDGDVRKLSEDTDTDSNARNTLLRSEL